MANRCHTRVQFTFMFLISCGALVALILLNQYVRPHQDSNPMIGADYIIRNASVWVGAAEYHEAIAIKDGKIIEVGSNANITRLLGGNTEVIDASQGLVLPGFIESHVHTISGGFSLSQVQLRDANTPELFISRIEQFAERHEGWILGGNWDNTLWDPLDPPLPTKEWIDNVTQNNPVWINRLDGHMGLANSIALQRAGITNETQSPEGGEIVKDEFGNPTGILKDNAMNLVNNPNVIPNPTPAQEDAALQAALVYLSENGITSIHHMGSWNDLDVFKRAYEKGTLSVRVYAAVPLSDWEELYNYVEANGKGDDYLKWGALKGFVDGSLGSQTALMFQPYLNNPDNSGLFVTPEEDLYAWTLQADKAQLHVCIHAIGDRANSVLLNVYKNVTDMNGSRDRRFRIEHAQHVRFSDIPLFTENDVIASVQPYHIIDDGRWAEPLIGPARANYSFPLKSFQDNNVQWAFGSDWDVAPASPVKGIYAAVTRATLDGKNPGGWIPNQKIDVLSSVQGYTAGAAYAEFADRIKGKIAPGYLADIVILNQNIFTIPPADIQNVQVMLTMVNGTIAFQKTKSKL